MVLVELLLISNFLIFLAIVLESKVTSRLGYLIVFSGVIVGIVDLVYALVLLFK